jgi:hypothetical protein
MRFLVIGDLHGRIKELARIDEYCVRNSINWVIQVGDLGVCWPGEDCPIIRYFRKRDYQKRPGAFWITCLGNHDNWNKWRTLRWEQAIKLGYLKNNQITHYPDLIEYAPGLCATDRPAFLDIFGGMLFCGGAVSTDADYTPSSGWSNDSHPGRTEGKDWWKNEAPSQEDLQKFCDLIDEKKPKYIFTHDGPGFAHHSRGSGLCLKSNLRYDYCSRSFETITKVTTHHPLRWFFGHHHELVETEKDGNIYHCSGLHGEGWEVNDAAGTATQIDLSLSKKDHKWY